MPKRGIDYCLDVMEHLKNKGLELQAPAADIRNAIAIVAGMQERTRKRYFHLLQEFGLIEPVGNGIFRLNWEKASEFML